MVILPEKRLALVEEMKPAAISKGAVSPITRAMARMAPEMIPGKAVRRTTRTMVLDRVTPKAYEASRRSVGTICSISWVERTTVGIMRMLKATAPTSPLTVPGPRRMEKKE